MEAKIKIMPDSWKCRRGFTLVEMLVAMGLAMMVLAGVVMLFSVTNQSYVRQDKLVTTEQNVRAAMEVMAHELRMAGYIPLDNLPGGAAEISRDVPGEAWSDAKLDQIEEASPTIVTFVSDLNADNVPETIRYTLTGTTLTRQAWQWNAGANAWEVLASGGQDGSIRLADDITAMSIVYVFENGASGIPNDFDSSTMNDRDDVRAVVLSMTGRTSTILSTGQYGFKTLKSVIEMRNMGLETRTR